MEDFGPHPQAAALQAYTEELQARFERMQAEGPEIHRRAREVQVTETSRDGLITVTVGARGDVVRLEIDPRVYRQPDSRVLADSITKTVRKAAAKAQDRVVELFEPIIPPDQMRLHLDGDLNGVLESIATQMLGRR